MQSDGTAATTQAKLLGMEPKAKRILTWCCGIGGAVVFIAALIWGPWLFEGNHVRDDTLAPSAGIIVTGFRTMLVALGAGAVAALGLHYTHKSHKQTEALFAHTREKDREQAELTREGQVTERYVEAIKLLASGHLTERLGGIYALERIMRDSEKDHATVVEVLAAFVRQHSPWKPDVDTGAAELKVRPADDVQAALTVLGRRPEREEALHIDLRRTDLRGADLQRARLQRAVMTKAHLEGANLARADLAKADLAGANLDRAWMLFTLVGGATLTDASLEDAYLRKIDLRSAILRADQLLNARIFEITSLPSRFADDERIQARIAECEAALRSGWNSSAT
ncbi:pentapeptide repeat-containing protein [Streptomyces sp. NPDC093568]|uniref:pentapeptide repeat-containing protein n=1 Tax=Streptomyces sp. NPDC093568 TaxID=3366041 RepID=UPI003810D303